MLLHFGSIYPNRSPAKESAGMTNQQPEQISSLTSPSNRGLQDSVNVEQTVTSPRLKDDKFHHIVDFVVSSAKIPKVVENYEEKNSASSNQNWKASNNRISPELPVWNFLFINYWLYDLVCPSVDKKINKKKFFFRI